MMKITADCYQMASEAGVQPHKYGGKELDRENGLDWYDSQARWYDPALGRTTTMDPLAEDYPGISPYAWCAGNPVRFVDPTGMTLSFDGSTEDIYFLLDQIQSICSGVVPEYTEQDSQVGYYTIDESELNEYSQSLIQIIDDPDINVKIKAIGSHQYQHYSIFGGAFMGTKISDSEGNVRTLNIVNNSDLSIIDTFAKMGTSLMHEITESYLAGKITQQSGIPAGPATKATSWKQNFIYIAAHYMALPQVPVFHHLYTDENGTLIDITFIEDENGQPYIIERKPQKH